MVGHLVVIRQAPLQMVHSVCLCVRDGAQCVFVC